MSDHPWDEVISAAQDHIANGSDLYQKYTCSGCGNRLSIEEPNKFYTKGACDNCDAITDIKKQGCNYMLVMPAQAELRRLTVADVP